MLNYRTSRVFKGFE